MSLIDEAQEAIFTVIREFIPEATEDEAAIAAKEAAHNLAVMDILNRGLR